MQSKTDVTDPRIIKALAHPLRIEILKLLDEGEASPVEVARRLDARVGSVSYHFKQLAELGLIQLTRTTPRRGAVEHHYGPVQVDDLDIGGWDRLPAIAKQGAAANSLAELASLLRDAASHAGFASPHARVVLETLTLDGQGEKEVAREIDAVIKRLRKIARESHARAKREGSAPRATAVAVLSFARESGAVEPFLEGPTSTGARR